MFKKQSLSKALNYFKPIYLEILLYFLILLYFDSFYLKSLKIEGVIPYITYEFYELHASLISFNVNFILVFLFFQLIYTIRYHFIFINDIRKKNKFLIIKKIKM